MFDEFENISIKDMINILIKRRKLIALVTAGILLLGIVQSFIITKPKYASSITLEINQFETSISSGEEPSRVRNLLESITGSTGLIFEDYVEEVTSDEVLEKTIEDLKLEDTYTAGNLRSDISVDEDSETKTIDVRVIANGPEKSSQILESLIENFMESITNIAQESSSNLLEVIGDQLEIEKDKYSQALKEYSQATKGIKTALEIELEIEGMYEQLTEYKLSLNDLQIKKDGINAGLKQSEESGNTNMSVRPNSNSESIYLDTGKGTLEIDLAETEARIDSTEKSIEDIQERIEDLKKDYQETEVAESVTRQTVDLTKESYEVFSSKYQELSMQSSMDVGSISINRLADTAMENTRVGTRKFIKLAMFLVLGLMTGVIVSFLAEYLEYMKKKKSKL